MNLRNMASIFLMDGNKILLLFRKGSKIADNLWVASAGGHFEKNELNNPEACALRELKEELSLTAEMISDLKLRYITLRIVNDEIRQNYYFFANFKNKLEKDIISNEGVCKWFDINEITSLEMPLSAKNMLSHFIETGRKNNKIYVGVAEGEESVFNDLT